MNRLNHMTLRACKKWFACHRLAHAIMEEYSPTAHDVKVEFVRMADESLREYLMARRIIECVRKPYRRVME